MTPHPSAAQPASLPPLSAGRFHLGGPADLIDAVPFLLGFHPADSLVAAVVLEPYAELVRTIRLDLPEIRGRPTAPADVGCALAESAARNVVLLLYGGRDDVAARLPDADLMAELTHGIRECGVTVLDALYVGARRWRSYHCDDLACCPLAGSPFGLPDSPVLAAATRAGLVALPDRAALVATLAPGDPAELASMSAAMWRAERAFVEQVAADTSPEPWRDAQRTELGRTLTEIAKARLPWLDDDAAARLLVALTDEVVRDDAWRWSSRLGHDRARLAFELWRGLARRASPPFTIAPMFLTAWSAWRLGDGVLAGIAVEHALTEDPDYAAAAVLLHMVRSGLSPESACSVLAQTPAAASAEVAAEVAAKAAEKDRPTTRRQP